MIVGVVTGPTVDEVAAEQRRCADLVDMFEVRLDLMNGVDLDQDWSPVFAKSPRPTIATCRHVSEGGQFSADEPVRREWLQMAIAAGAAWVDLELVSEIELVLGETRIVRSVHQFAGPTPAVSSLLALARHAEMLGADAFKFAFPAHRIADVSIVRDVCEQAPLPAVGIAMGALGVPSRIAYQALGSIWSYGPLPGNEVVAPGQIDVRLLRHRYSAHALHPDTRFFGVLGNPVSHSRGVRMHNAAFRRLPDLDACYLPLLTEDIDDFWRFARALPLSGFSVTAPFKAAVMKGLDALDPAAAAIGAVNTVVRLDDGRFVGHNTDLAGAFEPLDAMMRNGWAGKRALLLGAGGAARTIVAGLVERGVEVVILNRTRKRAEALAGAFAGRPVVVENIADAAAHGPFASIVNATTVGMHPTIDARPLDLPAAIAAGLAVTSDAVVFDLIYTPAPTRFLREAAELGLQTLDGRAMYRRQAELQFQHWHATDLPAEAELNEI